MAGAKDLVEVGKVCFYCSLKVPDKTSLALHYVRQHWEDVRRRQAQMYRPKPEVFKAGNIYAAAQPTSGQGGTVRRVSVMSADDELRMARRKEMLAAKRAQEMPPQKIKLVYSKNNKAITVNKKGEGKIAKLSAWDLVNEELRRRQKENMKVPVSDGVAEYIVKEACGDGEDASKQAGCPGEKGVNNSQVQVADEELIEVVGKVVGGGDGQEFEFDEEEIVVEDELLHNDQGGVDQVIDVGTGSVFGGDIVKEASGEKDAKCNAGAAVEKQGEQMESSPEIAERSVSPIIMSSRKKACLSSSSSTPSKTTSPSSSTPRAIYGFNTPSPSLERKSRALSSLIRSRERKAALRGETPFSSGEVTEEIGNGLGDLGQERLCEVRLVKLDKGLLLKATQGPGQGGERGMLSPDIEETCEQGFEMVTKRCDVKLAKLDKELLLPSVEMGGAIDQAKDTTPMKKKSCVVRLAKMAMLDKIINKAKEEEEGTDFKKTDAELVEEEKKSSDQDTEVFQPMVEMRDNLTSVNIE